MTSLKRNGPYMAALEGDINLVRANAGYGINKVTLFVDGKIMDATSLVEPSNYTIKVEETALYQQVRDAYLSGKEITVVALSDLGHTMVDTYRINPDVQKTFEECVSAENKSVPYNPYFSIDVEPLDTVPDGLVENLIGQQCLRGKVRPEDVTAVYTGDTARNYWRRWVHHELQSKTPVHNELRPGTITRASTIRDFAHAWCALHSWCGGSICTQI